MTSMDDRDGVRDGFDRARDFQLVPESFDRVLIGRDLWLDELYGDFCLDFFIEGLVDRARAFFTRLFDDLATAAKVEPVVRSCLGWMSVSAREGWISSGGESSSPHFSQ